MSIYNNSTFIKLNVLLKLSDRQFCFSITEFACHDILRLQFILRIANFTVYTFSRLRSRRQVDDTVDHVINITMPTVTWSQEFGETNSNVDVRRSLRNSFDVATGMTVELNIASQQ